MAKDKKKAKDKAPKRNDSLEVVGGGGAAAGAARKDKKKPRKAKGNGEGGVEALAAKILDHPLVTDLLAVGALAAVAAIAESGKADPAKAKSKDAVKAAGKAAAAAIGTRLLKEVTGGSKKA